MYGLETDVYRPSSTRYVLRDLASMVFALTYGLVSTVRFLEFGIPPNYRLIFPLTTSSVTRHLPQVFVHLGEYLVVFHAPNRVLTTIQTKCDSPDTSPRPRSVC